MSSSRALESGTILFVDSAAAMYHPRRYFLMACALHEAGLKVAVLAQPHLGPHPEGPVPGITLPRRSGRLSRMLSGPNVFLRVLRLRPAAVQINTLELLPWGVLIRYLRRIPVTYDSNDDYPSYMLLKQWIPRRFRPVAAGAVRVLEPGLARHLDAIFTADTGTGIKFRRSARRLLTVYNFPQRALAEEEERPVEQEFDVTYHGTLHSYYRDHMIETARILIKDGIAVRWCIAARGLGAREREALEARLLAAGVRDNFTLIYDLPFTEIGALLSQSRIGFIPLPDEPKYRLNLPRKLFEFLAKGVPVVASDLRPIRSLVGDQNCCVLVTPGDNRAYADAIGALMEDEDLRRTMGERGRALILERLNAETATRPYIDTYRALTNE